jgi:hypothetical protein
MQERSSVSLCELHARVIVNHVERPAACWRDILFGRVGAQDAYRDLDEVDPKLLVFTRG